MFQVPENMRIVMEQIMANLPAIAT